MNKYCIYKNPSGETEIWEYIDDVEEAKQYWYVKLAMDKFGIDNVMPICMNKLGGYHTCDKSRKIAIIEADHFPTLADRPDLYAYNINNPNFKYGWIDSEGNTYKCSTAEHTATASDFCTYLYPEEYTKWKVKNNKEFLNIPDDFLIEELGWIRVGGTVQYSDKNVSKKAMKKYLECIENDRKVHSI